MSSRSNTERRFGRARRVLVDTATIGGAFARRVRLRVVAGLRVVMPRVRALAAIGFAFVIAFAIGVTGAVRSQTPPPTPANDAHLQELLRELRAQDPAAWAARLAALEEQAKALEAKAAKLREQATTLQQSADAALAEAKSKRAEGDKLRELQKLLASLPASAGASPGIGKPDEAKAAAPKPPANAKSDVPDKQPPEPKAASTATAKNDVPDASPLVAWPQVAALFEANCTSCHEPGEQKGGLDLTTFRAALAGGGSGQSIVPGDPDQSRLYRQITLQEKPFMPRNADPLTKEQTALVRTWIEHGAAETADAARAFVTDRATKAKAAAVADVAAPDANVVADAMPSDVPPLAVQRPQRAGPMTGLVRSPAAPLLAVPGVQQIVLLGLDGAPRAVVPTAAPHVGAIAFAEDGTALAVAEGEPGRHGVVGVHDVRTGSVLATCGDERDVPLAVALHRGSGLVALGGAGKHVRVYRLANGALAMDGKHDDFVLGLSFSPDGKWLAAGDRAGNVLVWETAKGRLFQTLAGHRGAVHAVVFDRAGTTLLTAGADGTLRAWDVAAAKERWKQTAHPNQQCLACAFGPGGVIASCGSDGVIATFQANGKPGAKSAPVGDWLYSVAFGEKGTDVFAGDWQGRLQRFDAAKKTVTALRPLAAPQ